MSSHSTYGDGMSPISPETALERLAGWPVRRDQLAVDRAALVADAWHAGIRNVAQLARIADVSRDTIYADLRSHRIDPTDRSST
jgi:transcriptional regulator of acetoin/glycerol metabolism